MNIVQTNSIYDEALSKSNDLFSVPILFLIFNRPDTTQKVFEAIKKIKPAKLYIFADGPRLNKEGEEKACDEARKITENIDWPCEAHRKYSEVNLNCRVGVSSAIDWFFENEEEGIILEHDCLPNKSFFYFCEELLKKYRNVDKVKMISGDNFQFGKKYGEASYYFSNFPHIWGWATWRRAWKEYDVDMKSYPLFKKNNRIAQIFKNKKLQKYWLNLFDKLYDKKIDSWDGQLAYFIYNTGGVSILPNVNLISNIGFGEKAYHTKDSNDILSNIQTVEIKTIIHPNIIVINEEADANYSSFLIKNIFVRIFRKLKVILS